MVAHDKAVYDISWSLEESIFATVGEDGSVRLFDIRELSNSNIVYECENKTGLTHIKWNMVNPDLMAVVAENDSNVLLFDRRKPNHIVETLHHDAKVTAIAWAPHNADLICSVSERGSALIWDLKEGLVQDGANNNNNDNASSSNNKGDH